MEKSLMEKSLMDRSVLYDEIEEFDIKYKQKMFDYRDQISNYKMLNFKQKNSFNKNKDDEDSIASEKEDELEIQYYIPCLLLEPIFETDHILIYFHGNGEDIQLSYELLNFLRNYLQVRIIAMEYPGYGIYKYNQSKQDRLFQDAEAVYDYLIKQVHYSPKNILVFGRSIGSGVASHLASVRQCGALCLMSPFTSLRAVVKDMVGNWSSYLVKERFCNIDLVKNIKIPIFLVHGLKDKLVSYRHSQELYRVCQKNAVLNLQENMGHIEFDFEYDLAIPLGIFLNSHGYRPKINIINYNYMQFPKQVYYEQTI